MEDVNPSTGLISSHPRGNREGWRTYGMFHQFLQYYDMPKGCDKIRPVLGFFHMNVDRRVGTNIV